MEKEEIQKVLEASSLFSSCGFLADKVRVKLCQKGQIVNDHQQGEEILGLVAEGALDVYSIAMDGREVILSHLKKGECFGLINLLADAELPTVLKCSARTTLLLIPKKLFVQAMKKDSALAVRYASFCNQKLLFLIRKIEFLTMQSGKNRLIQYLLMWQEDNGNVRLDGSKDSLAASLGISRASLFRELAFLQEKGLIKRRPGQIHIMDRERLEHILYETA